MKITEQVWQFAEPLVKEQGWEVDLTCKLQLRDDCAAIEKLIKKIEKGKYKQKDLEGLKLAIIRLQTTSDGILKRSV